MVQNLITEKGVIKWSHIKRIDNSEEGKYNFDKMNDFILTML